MAATPWRLDLDALPQGSEATGQFTYKVKDDSNALSNPATATITITGTNDNPTNPVEGVIDSDNFDSTNLGFVITGQTVQRDNGELQLVNGSVIANPGPHSQYHPKGFGVAGLGGDAASSETTYHWDAGLNRGLSEQLTAIFDNNIASAEVTFAWHGNGESAVYQLYLGDVLVGGGTTDENAVDPTIELKLDDGVFNRIVFSAPGSRNDTNNDYLIQKIEYTEARVNQVEGSNGADILVGGPEGGIIIGHEGNDQLTGSAGSDTFQFSADDLLDNGDIQTDIVTDFKLGKIESNSEADILDLSDLLVSDGTAELDALLAEIKAEGLSASIESDKTIITFDNSINNNNQTLEIVLDGVGLNNWADQNGDDNVNGDDVLMKLINDGQLIV